MKTALGTAMIAFARTPAGRETLMKLSSITGLEPCTDRDFDSTREAVRALGRTDATP